MGWCSNNFYFKATDVFVEDCTYSVCSVSKFSRWEIDFRLLSWKFHDEIEAETSNDLEWVRCSWFNTIGSVMGEDFNLIFSIILKCTVPHNRLIHQFTHEIDGFT